MLRILPFPPSNGNALLGLNAGSIFPTCAEVKFPQVAGSEAHHHQGGFR